MPRPVEPDGLETGRGEVADRVALPAGHEEILGAIRAEHGGAKVVLPPLATLMFEFEG